MQYLVTKRTKGKIKSLKTNAKSKSESKDLDLDALATKIAGLLVGKISNTPAFVTPPSTKQKVLSVRKAVSVDKVVIRRDTGMEANLQVAETKEQPTDLSALAEVLSIQKEE